MNQEEKKENITKGNIIRTASIKVPSKFIKKINQIDINKILSNNEKSDTHTTTIKVPFKFLNKDVQKTLNLPEKEVRTSTNKGPSIFTKKDTRSPKIKVPSKFAKPNEVLKNQKDIDYTLKQIRVNEKEKEINVRNVKSLSKSVTLINRNNKLDQNKADFSLGHFKKISAENPLSPSEWGKIKRSLWKQIHSFIIKNKSIITNIETNSSNNDDKLNNIKELISNILEHKTDLLLVNTISGQEKMVSDLTHQYIIAIWLIDKKPPPERKIIRNMSGLEYKIINQIVDYLNIYIPKAKTGTPIDPDVLKKILIAIEEEISNYNQGFITKSLSKIGKDLGINQSVISYYGNLNYPKEYTKIWGRDEDWKVSEEEKHLVLERIKKEIKKYDNNQTLDSLNSIAKDFNRSYEKIRQIAKNKYPTYFSLIWKEDNRLSAKQKKKLYERLAVEVKKDKATTLSEIGRDLRISYDLVRYYAKKKHNYLFGDVWGKSRTTSDEIEAIQDRFEEEILKFEKYNEKIPLYDKFNQKFDFTKNKKYKPTPIIDIANDFNRSENTISRIFSEIDSQSYDEIYAKPRLTEEKLESIISDILCTKIPLTGIAEKHNVSIGTISRISIEDVQPNYNNYDHRERFPQDEYQQLGFLVHQIIEHVSTQHFLKFKIYKFSEIPDGNYIIDDLLPCIEKNKFYNKIIKENKERLSLWREIGLEICECNEIVFEYTSYISKKQYLAKTKKYYKDDRFILIVGTRWYDKKYSNPIIHTRFENVTIIRHDILVKLLGLSGVLLEEFDKVIRLNYNYNLDEMKKFKNEIIQKYPKFGFSEYKKYCNRHQ